jgi:hypothetical protein
MVHAAIVADLSIYDQTGSRPSATDNDADEGTSGRSYLKCGHDSRLPRASGQIRCRGLWVI